jgi:hypothetical protein
MNIEHWVLSVESPSIFHLSPKVKPHFLVRYFHYNRADLIYLIKETMTEKFDLEERLIRFAQNDDYCRDTS